MDTILTIVAICVTILVVLVGVLLRSWMNEMQDLKQSLKNGLSSKVDGIEYNVKTKWQEAEYGDLKVTIKELKVENDASHRAILIELQRTNDALQQIK